MSIITEVKCARCDRKYSGMRSRCPYCGARRIGQGKYSGETDNSKGKMLIGILILAVLVVAAAVLLITSEKPQYTDTISSPRETPQVNMPDEESNTSVTSSNSITPPPVSSNDVGEDVEDPSASPDIVEVISVDITYSNIKKTDFTAKINERVPLRARIEPVGISEPALWTSSNPNVFQVVADNVEGTSAMVTGIGVGTATLTVSVGGKEATCIVRVN